MFWGDKALQNINPDQEQVINDSKTPSGRVHVGALRGVVIHDVVYRILKERNIPVRYLFGVDDYDPLDELPAGEEDFFRPYLGMPLCNVPAPPASDADDIAEYYIREFFDVFLELDVHTENYRMRDLYRDGRMNEVIDTILRNADSVRRIYKEVSKSERRADWIPFQVICENCRKIGTTQVTSYDGEKVGYKCVPNLVTWAEGCGHEGAISPFDGNGKLPWKLEWVAKWKILGVTIEGAGKDHSTKGGSRDVASRCLREIFNQSPPLNVPYEFFLVGGAKMSSSRGLGATARAMADFIPPEVLRFLMLRSQPNRPVNFSPDEKYILKLFNEYDRLHQSVFKKPDSSDDQKRVYALSETTSAADFYDANFQFVVTLVQMPHLDVHEQIEKHKGSALTEPEKDRLVRRIKSAQYWVENYASEEEKTCLQETLPERAQELDATQRAFLNLAADAFTEVSWDAESLQGKLFHLARITPLKQSVAFQAIYRVILDRTAGPRAGNLLSFLESEFIISRFRDLTYSKEDFWSATAISTSEFEGWLGEESENIVSAHTKLDIADSALIGVVEVYTTMTDEKEYVKRIFIEPPSDKNLSDPGQLRLRYKELATAWLNELIQKFHLKDIGLPA